MVRLCAALALAVSLWAASACTLFDDDPPADTCATDTDCFRAQDEFCHPTSKTCELRPDAGVDAP